LLKPRSVLEIGPGLGLTKAVGALYGIDIRTADIDSELNPDYVCSAVNLPFEAEQFDLSCAFQMLEHLPYSSALAALAEMSRVSRKNVVLSLPDAQRAWQFLLEIPVIGMVKFLVPRPQFRPKEHVFDGEHYWEIGKQGYSLPKFLNDAVKIGLSLHKTYRVHSYPYHRFFVFNKSSRVGER
jgi:predicted SAM-dependent methyltransferase